MAIKTNLKNQLQQRFTDRIRFDEPMSAHTSFRVGGPADALVTVTDEKEMAFLMPFLHDNGLPFLILGGGTNLLVKDGGFPGVVIFMTGRLSEIFQIAATKMTAMAGAKLNKLCRYAIEKGLAGMNFAVGIPGTVGGAIRMNAGTATGAMGGVLESVRVMGSDGEIIKLDASRLRFGYRHMTLPETMNPGVNPFVIIDGQFSLAAGSPETLAAEADVLLKKRKAAQPVHLASAGCFFKNPAESEAAGKLIDMAGLKGLRVGDAEVSALHANYLVNRGNASAADILKLMEIVREKVVAAFNIYLEPEVQIVGN
jgi:UDP-N-acetylmuramate dehydrogenase